ncbi:unnamed protein product, partial [Musa banksii]
MTYPTNSKPTPTNSWSIYPIFPQHDGGGGEIAGYRVPEPGHRRHPAGVRQAGSRVAGRHHVPWAGPGDRPRGRRRGQGRAARAIADASREWGIFRLVNHGVPVGVVRELQRVGVEFFELPQEEKERYAAAPGSLEGYGTRLPKDSEGKKAWVDFLFHNIWPPQRVDHRMWPKNPADYRRTRSTPNTCWIGGRDAEKPVERTWTGRVRPQGHRGRRRPRVLAEDQ